MPRADRIFRLVQLLNGTRLRSLAELTAALETTPRSIYRDLADLEARGIPIDRIEGSYRIATTATIRPLPLTASERLLLTLALQNPLLDRQPAFAKTLRDLRGKLTAAHALPDTPLRHTGPDRSGELPPEVVEAVDCAIRGSHSISMLYTSLSGRQKRWRGIDPWLMFHRSDAWYLLGRCHTHDEPRTFRLDRIAAVLPIGTAFTRPPSFDPDSWFAGSWGVESGTAPLQIRIIFDADVAPLIENGRHHPSEGKRRLDDGTLEYTLEVAPSDDLARWICGFGGAARVDTPDSLARRVEQIASGAAAAHHRRKAAMSRRL